MSRFGIVSTRTTLRARFPNTYPSGASFRSDLCRDQQEQQWYQDECARRDALFERMTHDATKHTKGDTGTAFRIHSLRVLVAEAARQEIQHVPVGHASRAAVCNGWKDIAEQLERHLAFEGAQVQIRHYGLAAYASGRPLSFPAPDALATTALENISAMGLWFPDIPSPAFGRWRTSDLSAAHGAFARGEADLALVDRMLKHEALTSPRVANFCASQNAKFSPPPAASPLDMALQTPGPGADGDQAFQYSSYVTVSRELRQMAQLRRMLEAYLAAEMSQTPVNSRTATPHGCGDSLGETCAASEVLSVATAADAATVSLPRIRSVASWADDDFSDYDREETSSIASDSCCSSTSDLVSAGVSLSGDASPSRNSKKRQVPVRGCRKGRNASGSREAAPTTPGKRRGRARTLQQQNARRIKH